MTIPCSLLIALSCAQAQAEPPRDPIAALLAAEPYDRLELDDGVSVEIEPVSPRPLPPYDAIEARKIRVRNQSKPSELREPEPPDKYEVRLRDPEADIRDFLVSKIKVRRVEYFEDMLLAAALQQIQQRKYERAFELLAKLYRIAPQWNGLAEARDRLLFEEGGAALVKGETARGMRLLSELNERKPDYPGLADRLASVFRARIDASFDGRDFAQARLDLAEAERLTPNAPQVQAARERFLSTARGLVTKAQSLSPAEKLDAIAEAQRIWPDLEGLGAAYQQAFLACPTLDVAAADAPAVVGPYPLGPAERRAASLMYAPILAGIDEAATSGQLPDQLAARFEKRELGKSVQVAVKPGLSWSDGRRPVEPADLAAALIARADPASPAYSARWADLISRVEIAPDRTVQLSFARPPLRPEFWMLDPIPPAHASADGWVWSGPERRDPVGDGPFRFASRDTSTLILRRSAAATAPGAPKIERIRERHYRDPVQALTALRRGQVHLVEHVPPALVGSVSEIPGATVGLYEQPALHVIAVDGRNPALRLRTLRRALSAAIDRKILMQETILRGPIDGNDAPADGPFLKGSPADAPAVLPLESDPVLALMLVGAAQRELGGANIALRFEYPSLPEVRGVVPKIVEAWTKAGLKITAVERTPSELERRLRTGERFDLAYRVPEVRDPILDAGPLISPSYDAPESALPLEAVPSPRILQLLLRLEQTPEVASASALATQLDRECRDELPMIPLWQLDRHFAWSPRLKGPSGTASALYQGLAAWEAQP